MKISITCKPGTSSLVKTGNWREESYPVFDHEICIGCKMCALMCPEGICFDTGEKNSRKQSVYEADLDYCKGCSICAEVCPVKAITMKEENK